jgi:hypothetical protein
MIRYELSRPEYTAAVTRELAYLTDFLRTNNYELVVTDNVSLLAKSLSELDNISYPSAVDPAILETTEDDRCFCLLLYRGDLLIGTYFAKQINFARYIVAVSYALEEYDFLKFKNHIEQLENFNDTWYSSAQWTHPSYRGRDLGTILDYAKKQLVYNVFNGTHNFCLHDTALTDYHTKTLGYDNSLDAGMLVTQDNRVYLRKLRTISISTKENWKIKFPVLHSKIKSFVLLF